MRIYEFVYSHQIRNSLMVIMFDQLKPLMQNGERYIVVEGGEPQYVLMRFSDYMALAAGRRDNPGRKNRPAGEWEHAPASSGTEFEEMRTVTPSEPSFASSVRANSPHPNLDPTTIRLEDLPL